MPPRFGYYVVSLLSLVFQVWHIKPEYHHHLGEATTSTGKKKKGDASAAKKRKSVGGTAESVSGLPTLSDFSDDKRNKKKSRISSDENLSTLTPKSESTGKGKKKNAFSIFVKDKRLEVEKHLGPDHDVSFMFTVCMIKVNDCRQPL